MSFAEAAGQLMALSALLLGWRPAEFWAATPAELAAILTLWRDGTDAGGAGMDAGMLAMMKERFPDG